eukprot:snap_masked-scaffold_27-processed-gene-2.23-mRNA-1 protein AED:0.00 eAED:0.00 QI:0/-1/0/1/-1/1/1/0/467
MTNKPYLIYQLGTNNWQIGEEYAPGSGILHQAHHVTYNGMDDAKSYSMFPSKEHSDLPEPDPTVKIFKLDHEIPIAEGSSPVSNLRWHTFSKERFFAYKKRLEDEVYNQMEAAETTEGKEFDLMIAHHTFLNPWVLKTVNERRVAAGKSAVPLVCFVHGTVLKMYEHEKKDDPNSDEYRLKWEDGTKTFLSMVQKEKLFEDKITGVKICYAISNQQVDALKAVFTTFDGEVVISPNGVNQLIFNPQKFDATHPQPKFNSWGGEQDFGIPSVDVPFDDFKFMVCFVGKFADWKRVDVLLKAAAIYEGDEDINKLGKVATIIVGKGSVDAQKQLFGIVKEKGLKNTYFLGPKPQPVLAQLYTMASVGVFPSHNEPFGMVFIECMACGTPVIGAKSGGPIDFVTDDVGALVEESEDKDVLSERFAAKIKEALLGGWKENKGPKALSKAVEEYSVIVQCEALLSKTKSVLN